MNAILITGNTYPHRRAMRSAGALFDREEKGYIAAADNQAARSAAEAAGLDISDYDASEDQLTPATGDRLRQIRQEKRERYANRLRDRADAADRRAEKALGKISDGERDFLRLAEPVKIGHHSERRHRKLIKRAQDSAMEAGRELNAAAKLREKADWVDAIPARVKGDAERERNRKIAAAKEKLSAGDLVDTMYGPAILERVNQKTARIRVERTGSCFSEPLHFLRLLEKREPVAKVAAFKKGDKVYVQRFHGKAPSPGVILRKTPRGYSVKYYWSSRALGGGEYVEKQTFVERDITPRAEVFEKVDG